MAFDDLQLSPDIAALVSPPAIQPSAPAAEVAESDTPAASAFWAYNQAHPNNRLTWSQWQQELGPISPTNALAPAAPPADAAYPEDLDAVILRKEGSGDREISPAGAIGRNQVMPSTGAQYGYSREDLFDPAKNMEAGNAIRRDLWNRYHDRTAVMVAYNAGPGVANRWLAAGRDPSVLPAETQRYIGVSSGGTDRGGPRGIQLAAAGPAGGPAGGLDLRAEGNELMPQSGGAPSTSAAAPEGAPLGGGMSLQLLGLLAAGQHRLVQVSGDPFRKAIANLPSTQAGPISMRVPDVSSSLGRVAGAQPGGGVEAPAMRAPYLTRTGMREYYDKYSPGVL